MQCFSLLPCLAVTLQLLQAEKMALQRGVAELESELPLHDITAEDKFRANLDV
jgi:hypothetical protein